MSTIFNISDKIKFENTPQPLLLNYYGGAAAAYSLRQLDYNYTDAAITVRRDSDNTEKNIGFVNGELDTQTLEDFTTETVVHFNEDFTTDPGWNLQASANISNGKLNFINSTGTTQAFENYGAVPYTRVRVTYTITDYTSGVVSFINLGGGGSGTQRNAVGTYVEDFTLGNGNANWGFWTISGFTGSIDNYKVEVIACNAFVTTWYDQSGNGNDATQTTASAQPKIVSLGSTILENGKAAFEFDGSDDVLRYQGDLVTDSVSSIFTSLNVGSFGGFSTFIDRYNNPDNGTASIRSTSGANTLDINSITTTNASYQNSQLLVSAFQSSGSFAAYIDGASVGTASNSANYDGISIGASRIRGSILYSSPKMQEVILYNSDETANRTSIETNINDFYSIY